MMSETEDGFGVNKSKIGDLQESYQEKAEEVSESEMDAMIQGNILGEVRPVVIIIAEERVEWMNALLGE